MQAALRLHAGDDEDDRYDGAPWRDAAGPADLEDLAYRVEVWDESGSFAEVVVAVTATASLAYAAYYAAAKEFVGRDVTLRHKGLTLSHWRARPN